MVRHTGGEGTFNRGITSGAETNSTGPDDDRFICNCISDKCAMWRWAEKPDRRSREADNPHLLTEHYRPTLVPASWVFVPYNVARGEPAKWVEPDDAVRARRQGFCGLAGRPGVA